MKYGVPYMGSKSKLAYNIVGRLPKGNRLVDLFGGGFAITHCAMTTFFYKYNEFLYNDINPLIVNLVKDAIHGKYDEKTFKPEWISREKFNELKDKDGYIKYIWSFSNQGDAYMFGKDIEELKHSAHNWVVFDIKDKTMQELFPDLTLLSLSLSKANAIN